MPAQVLLAEDSRAMRQYVRAILESGGDHEVQEVDNGFDALRVLPRQRFDLIVTDINMPDVSGIELVRFVRSGGPHVETPIVVISTDATTKDVERARAAGASAFVAKPFTGQDLLDAIARAREAVGEGSAAP